MIWIMGGAAGVAIMLLVFSIRSLVMLFVEPKQVGAIRTESVAAEMQDASIRSEAQGSKNHEREAVPITLPLPAAAEK
ncbi:MAG: hypothetical protein ABIH24_05635 [Verrucomicrobiota bacterium]